MSNTTAANRPSNAASIHAPRWLSHLMMHLRSAHSATEQAHNQRRMYDHNPDAAFHDAGISRDDAMGIGRHRDTLPFFLQSGFDRQ